jgi:formylglycine-generating enzyme required for sulfatase activity
MKSLYFKIRGCSWYGSARGCRLAGRSSFEPVWRLNFLGFRVFQRYK